MEARTPILISTYSNLSNRGLFSLSSNFLCRSFFQAI
nr:MAG TPA: hypothetical protein [Caudoviricetes sp.]